jgi:hypothetical protein
MIRAPLKYEDAPFSSYQALLSEDTRLGGCMIQPSIASKEHQFIGEAASFLETPSTLVSMSQYLGKPLDRLQQHLSERTRLRLHQAIEKSLKLALKWAIQSLDTKSSSGFTWEAALEGSRRTGLTHTAALGTTGAIGGALGTGALLLELPISTGLMLRGISSVAQEWGHDLHDPEIQMQCLYVFTLGSEQTNQDDTMASTYMSSRLAFHEIIREVASYLGRQSVKDVLLALEAGGAQLLLRFLGLLIPAFERAMLQKIVSRAVPVAGAIGGAALNAAFSHWFTQAARYHFGLLHLEKKYGADVLQRAYRRQARDAYPPLQLIC